jgi:hypothetical protein
MVPLSHFFPHGGTSPLEQLGTFAGIRSFCVFIPKPVSIYYTIDGSRPTFGSATLESAGIREGAETLTITERPRS